MGITVPKYAYGGFMSVLNLFGDVSIAGDANKYEHSKVNARQSNNLRICKAISLGNCPVNKKGVRQVGQLVVHDVPKCRTCVRAMP